MHSQFVSGILGPSPSSFCTSTLAFANRSDLTAFSQPHLAACCSGVLPRQATLSRRKVWGVLAPKTVPRPLTISILLVDSSPSVHQEIKKVHLVLPCSYMQWGETSGHATTARSEQGSALTASIIAGTWGAISFGFVFVDFRKSWQVDCFASLLFYSSV